MTDNPLAPQPARSQDHRLAAALSHGAVVALPALGPFVVWAVMRDRSAFVRYHSMQAMVAQGTWLVVSVLLSVLTCGVLSFVTAPLFLLTAVAELYMAWRAWQGEDVGYPGVEDLGR